MLHGWIKLHRQLLESTCFDNEKLLKVWIYCLLKATHKEHEQLIGRQKIILKPGQFIFGRNQAAEKLKMKPSTVWDYMNILKDKKSIDIKSNNKYSVITIDKWENYQVIDEDTDSKPNNKSTTNRQQIDTNKNVKNVKNDKEVHIDIFNHWNSKKITVHKTLTKPIEKEIEKAIKKITTEEIKQGIDRYYQAYVDNNFYYSHKWVLVKFLKQSNGINDWLDEGQRWVEYQDYLNKKKPKPKTPFADARVI